MALALDFSLGMMPDIVEDLDGESSIGPNGDAGTSPSTSTQSPSGDLFLKSVVRVGSLLALVFKLREVGCSPYSIQYYNHQ